MPIGTGSQDARVSWVRVRHNGASGRCRAVHKVSKPVYTWRTNDNSWEGAWLQRGHIQQSLDIRSDETIQSHFIVYASGACIVLLLIQVLLMSTYFWPFWSSRTFRIIIFALLPQISPSHLVYSTATLKIASSNSSLGPCSRLVLAEDSNHLNFQPPRVLQSIFKLFKLRTRDRPHLFTTR